MDSHVCWNSNVKSCENDSSNEKLELEAFLKVDEIEDEGLQEQDEKARKGEQEKFEDAAEEIEKKRSEVKSKLKEVKSESKQESEDEVDIEEKEAKEKDKEKIEVKISKEVSWIESHCCSLNTTLPCASTTTTSSEAAFYVNDNIHNSSNIQNTQNTISMSKSIQFDDNSIAKESNADDAFAAEQMHKAQTLNSDSEEKMCDTNMSKINSNSMNYSYTHDNEIELINQKLSLELDDNKMLKDLYKNFCDQNTTKNCMQCSSAEMNTLVTDVNESSKNKVENEKAAELLKNLCLLLLKMLQNFSEETAFKDQTITVFEERKLQECLAYHINVISSFMVSAFLSSPFSFNSNVLSPCVANQDISILHPYLMLLGPCINQMIFPSELPLSTQFFIKQQLCVLMHPYAQEYLIVLSNSGLWIDKIRQLEEKKTFDKMKNKNKKPYLNNDNVVDCYSVLPTCSASFHPSSGPLFVSSSCTHVCGLRGFSNNSVIKLPKEAYIVHNNLICAACTVLHKVSNDEYKVRLTNDTIHYVSERNLFFSDNINNFCKDSNHYYFHSSSMLNSQNTFSNAANSNTVCSNSEHHRECASCCMMKLCDKSVEKESEYSYNAMLSQHKNENAENKTKDENIDFNDYYKSYRSSTNNNDTMIYIDDKAKNRSTSGFIKARKDNSTLLKSCKNQTSSIEETHFIDTKFDNSSLNQSNYSSSLFSYPFASNSLSNNCYEGNVLLTPVPTFFCSSVSCPSVSVPPSFCKYSTKAEEERQVSTYINNLSSFNDLKAHPSSLSSLIYSIPSSLLHHSSYSSHSKYLSSPIFKNKNTINNDVKDDVHNTSSAFCVNSFSSEKKLDSLEGIRTQEKMHQYSVSTDMPDSSFYSFSNTNQINLRYGHLLNFNDLDAKEEKNREKQETEEVSDSKEESNVKLIAEKKQKAKKEIDQSEQRNVAEALIEVDELKDENISDEQSSHYYLCNYDNKQVKLKNINYNNEANTISNNSSNKNTADVTKQNIRNDKSKYAAFRAKSSTKNLVLSTKNSSSGNDSKRSYLCLPSSSSLYSTIVGVVWIPRHEYWRARWTDYKTGELISRYFSAKKHGFEKAKSMATEARLNAVFSRNNYLKNNDNGNFNVAKEGKNINYCYKDSIGMKNIYKKLNKSALSSNSSCFSPSSDSNVSANNILCKENMMLNGKKKLSFIEENIVEKERRPDELYNDNYCNNNEESKNDICSNNKLLINADRSMFYEGIVANLTQKKKIAEEEKEKEKEEKEEKEAQMEEKEAQMEEKEKIENKKNVKHIPCHSLTHFSSASSSSSSSSFLPNASCNQISFLPLTFSPSPHSESLNSKICLPASASSFDSLSFCNKKHNNKINKKNNNNSKSNNENCSIVWLDSYRCWQANFADPDIPPVLFSAKKYGVEKSRKMAINCIKTGDTMGCMKYKTVEKLKIFPHNLSSQNYAKESFGVPIEEDQEGRRSKTKKKYENEALEPQEPGVGGKKKRKRAEKSKDELFASFQLPLIYKNEKYDEGITQEKQEINHEETMIERRKKKALEENEENNDTLQYNYNNFFPDINKNLLSENLKNSYLIRLLSTQLPP